jgi:hypothetical protein
MRKREFLFILFLVYLFSLFIGTGAVLADTDQSLSTVPPVVREDTSVDPQDNLSEYDVYDDFDRPNGPLGYAWTDRAGTFQVSNMAAVGDGSLALATYNGATSDELECDVRHTGETALQYVGLVLAYADIDNNLFIKVQDNSSAGDFTHYAFYYGNNGGAGPWTGGGFFALDAPFSSAHMRVELDGATVTLTFTNIDGGSGVQTYTATAAPDTGGNGIGICAWSSPARIDRFAAPRGPIECAGVRNTLTTPTYVTQGTGVGSGRGIGFQANETFKIYAVGISGALRYKSFDVVIYSSPDGHTAGSQLQSTSLFTGGTGDEWNDMVVVYTFQSGNYYVINWRPSDGLANAWAETPGIDYYHDSGLPYTTGPITIVEGFEGYDPTPGNIYHPLLRFCTNLEDTDYSFTSSGGFLWRLNVIDSSIWPYLFLKGTVDMGYELRAAVATYNGYNCAISFMANQGSRSSGCPFNYNFRFSGPTGAGVWVNTHPSAGHGSVTVNLSSAEAASPPAITDGPIPGIEE